MLAWALAVAAAWPAVDVVARCLPLEPLRVAEVPQPPSSTRRKTTEVLRNVLSDGRSDRFDLGIGIGQPLDALLDLRRRNSRVCEAEARLTALEHEL